MTIIVQAIKSPGIAGCWLGVSYSDIKLRKMSSLQGPVLCPVVRGKQTCSVNSSIVKAKMLRSKFWGSSSNDNGSMAENFSESEADYVNSSVVEAVEVRSGKDGFMIKMRDGRHVKCVHNDPQGAHLPDYAPHPAMVLRMEDGTGLLLPIIVLEMPNVLLMAAVRNVQLARPTVYQVLKDMVEKMGYAVKLVRVTKRVDEAYLSKLYLTKLDNDAESISFDLSPSDAINIAVKCKVPVQVNKNLAYSDGMRIVESANPSPCTATSDSLLFSGLDKTTGQPYIDEKEFILVRNMLVAAVEERYRDAGTTCLSPTKLDFGTLSRADGEIYFLFEVKEEGEEPPPNGAFTKLFGGTNLLNFDPTRIGHSRIVAVC
ncbi:hypothetical protein K7X08_013822 [Anisodus acutangulus]|uniref:BFN domain-containing protein n=1 Tax=Anisodus acutangulus TaxID=402998 RepID=A0A9Q1LNN6_9SOLA|nr:hypothetical protein K7X08_013822 [Anisodus acutangulus]